MDFKETAKTVLEKFGMLEFGKAVYQYIVDNPFQFWLLVGFSAFMAIIIAVIFVLGILSMNKKRAIKKAMNAQTKAADPITSPAETVEETAEESLTEEIVDEETAEEPVPEESVEEIANEDAPAEEETAEPANETVIETPVEETVAPVEETVAETPVEEVSPVEETAEEETKAVKYRGKWVLNKMIFTSETTEETEEMYFFELRASNGEKLLESEEYTTLLGAKKGIATHVTNIKNGNFKIALTKKGTYIFKLMSGKNMLLCTGENYPTKARCERAVESTKRFAETAIIDETVQEINVTIPVEEETAAAPIPENANGKWIILKSQTEDGESYYFELRANNGEKLLSSEDYTSFNGAQSGLETHKRNVEKGNFRITLTKRGDYIFKLLNGNGQLLCLGEHYKTKRACQSAVDSVKRFALSSPILTDVDNVKA